MSSYPDPLPLETRLANADRIARALEVGDLWLRPCPVGGWFVTCLDYERYHDVGEWHEALSEMAAYMREGEAQLRRGEVVTCLPHRFTWPV